LHFVLKKLFFVMETSAATTNASAEVQQKVAAEVKRFAQNATPAEQQARVDQYFEWLQNASAFEAIATFLLGRLHALSEELNQIYEKLRKGKRLPTVEDEESAQRHDGLLEALALILKQTNSLERPLSRRFFALYTDYKIFRLLLGKLNTYAQEQDDKEQAAGSDDASDRPVPETAAAAGGSDDATPAPPTSTDAEKEVAEAQQCPTPTQPAAAAEATPPPSCTSPDDCAAAAAPPESSAVDLPDADGGAAAVAPRRSMRLRSGKTVKKK
jgi:hypothetical protein